MQVKTGIVNFMPGVLRMSTALRKLREKGSENAAKVVEDLYKQVGSQCPNHGELKDPLIFTAPGNKVAFGCPWCSDPGLLKLWEKEGEANASRDS